jgi:hypothetical protein
MQRWVIPVRPRVTHDDEIERAALGELHDFAGDEPSRSF